MRTRSLGFLSLLGVSVVACGHAGAPSPGAVRPIAAATSSERPANKNGSAPSTESRVEGPCARHDDLPPFRLVRPHVARTADDHVLVVSEGPTTEVAELDPVCRTWTSLPKPAARRTDGSAIAELTSGDLLVVGGTAASQSWAERLPRGGDAWQPLAASGKVAADKTGQLFAISDDRAIWVGSTIAIYDGKTHLWQALGAVEDPVGRSAIRLSNDEVVVVGNLRPTLVVDGKKAGLGLRRRALGHGEIPAGVERGDERADPGPAPADRTGHRRAVSADRSDAGTAAAVERAS